MNSLVTGTFTVKDFDRIVQSFYEGSSNLTRHKAQLILTEFQSNPDSWQLVDQILEQSTSLQAKFIALGILEEFVKVRWNILSMDQRLALRNYIAKRIIELSSNETVLRSETAFINKLDLVLVQILKKDWPQHWPSFIPEIVASSLNNSSLCENNMKILKYLSEEVFDFSIDHMTVAKMNKLKNQMVNEFGSILDLCKKVLLSQTTNEHLVKSTLKTLLKFISWIPVQFVYQQDLIRILESSFKSLSSTQRNLALQCLTEIISLDAVDSQQYSDIILNIYAIVYKEMIRIIPESSNIARLYTDPSTNEDDQHFIELLAIFITTTLEKYRALIEKTEDGQSTVHASLVYLLEISRVPEQEVWKICLEYWGKLTYDIVQDSNHGQPTPYHDILKQLGFLMIKNMVKPDDVLIIENDEGEIYREFIKQSDTTALFKSMRQVFSLLTSLDPVSIHAMIHEKIKQLKFLNASNSWSWKELFRVCWAIGSISGAISQQQETRFLESIVLTDLFQLLQKEESSTTGNRDQLWVVASCLLYIAGQYPHFLKSHWDLTSFLIHRIFEYMQQEQEDIREMACNSFLNISQGCKEELVVSHQLPNGQEVPSFLEISLTELKKMTTQLTPQQTCLVYEAIGIMISSVSSSQVQELSINKLMEIPNEALRNVTQDSRLYSPKVVIHILKVNLATCKHVGPIFRFQLQAIIGILTQCYMNASEQIKVNSTNDQHHQRIRQLILELLETFILSNDRLDLQDQTTMSDLIQLIVVNYKSCALPEQREPSVLSLLTSLFEKMQEPIWPDLLQETIDIEFVTTLPMITANFVDYPDIRHEFYRLLRVLNRRCFIDLFHSSQLFPLVIDSIMWGTKHTIREISQIALRTCLDMINAVSQMEDEDIASQFFESFYVRILRDILEVLVDPDCRNGFNYQSQVLSRMFELVQEGEIYTRLFDPNKVSNPLMSNVEFLQQYVLELLCTAFPLLQKDQIEVLVMGMFEYSGDLQRFQNDIRDFLIDIREVGEESIGQQRAEEEINAELELLRDL